MCVYRFSFCLITMWLGMGLLVPVAVAEEVAESEAIILEDTDLEGLSEEAIATALLDGPEGGCEQLGRVIFDFGLRNYVYRGNMFEIDVDAVVTEFGFELEIPTDVEIDLWFSIHCETAAGPPYFETCFLTDPPVHVTGNGEWTFYTTGDLDTPFPLEAGATYVLGVAWGLPQAKYGYDPGQSGGTRFPNFLNGIYRGRVSDNLDPQTEPPLIDGEDGRVMLENTSGGPWSMLLCLAGACCLPDSTCADLSENACLAAGGTFTAPGLACTDIDCPVPPGACCLENEVCLDINEYQCGFEGGTWFVNESCEQTFPPCEPRGGCCIDPPGTDCIDNLTEDMCEIGQVGGWWRGADNPCEDYPPCTGGACCSGGGCGPASTAEGCLRAEGLLGGYGSNCDMDPCDPVGACCYYPADPGEDPYCIDGKSEGQCAAENGVYRGDWSLCTKLAVPCDGGGACCVEGVPCFETQQSTCGDLDGVYTDGVACAELDPLCPGNCCWQLGCATGREPWECEGLPLGTESGFFVGYELPCDWDVAACLAADSGACCLPDGGCIQATQNACVFEVGGVYRGDDTLCGSVVPPCAPPPIGACCLARGECAELTIGDCDDVGGLFLGEEVMCEAGLCVAGACCVPLETCVLTDGAACKALDPLASFEAGVPCLDSDCPAVGACCLPNGDCEQQTESNCDDNHGVYRGDGQICAELDPPCPPPGACCKPDQSCEMLTDFGCDDVDGRFQGEGSVCEANTCNLGACCMPDGTCEVDSLALECEGQNGIFHEGEECPPLAGCDPAGACCVAPEACQSLTAAACADAGGEHAGDDVPCDDQICLPGACCLLDGGCLDNAYVFECEASCGDFVIDDFCSQIPCPPRGACCDQDNSCTILTEDSCLALAGDYIGTGIPCQPCVVMLDSDPPSGAIDARQPSDPDGSNTAGWQTVVIGFSGATCGMTADDFTIDVTSGTAPTIISVLSIGTTAVIDFDGPIPAGAWTRITHDDSGTSVCLGYLPADTDGDRTSAPADILKVIDHLNGVDVRPVYSVDMDRDGEPAPADILRVIDLLNGAAMYDIWLDASLPESPCGGP